LLIASPLVAQTAGRIQGTVTDNTGAPVPGVAVTATSPNLQGVQSTTTDTKGEFRFLSVPPGTYAVKVDLSGFKTVNQTGVVVGLDRTVTLGFKMEVAGVAETVTVTGESPVIDTSSTTTGVNATAELFNRIPVQRDIYSISRVAPGTQNDGVGAVVYGSSGAENNYIIDGLNTTGIEVGREMKQLNFDFVEEIEVKTGGLPAEYGRMTGGIVNVLTKGQQQLQGRRLRLLRGRRAAERRLDGGRSAGDHDAGHRHRQPLGLRRRPGRLPGEGQALVLRRVQPHEPHRQRDGHPRAHRAGEPRHRIGDPQGDEARPLRR
jgi:hypothetical protein